MTLIKKTLGSFIELRGETNIHLIYGPQDVRGVNNQKLLMPTKADLSSRDLSTFQIVYPGDFVFNHRTSRNGDKFSIAYNDTDAPVICTEDYVVFRIKEAETDTLCAEWLYLFFNRPEFDRYVITNSWGSSTEFFNWEDICNIKLSLPNIQIQKKYVAMYHAMQENQHAYEQGLDDLKLCCDAFIENLRKQFPCEPIGPYLALSDSINGNAFGISQVRGLAVSKEIIPTKADMKNVSLTNYKLVPPEYIAYVPDTSRRGNKISLAQNTTDETFLVSSISMVFSTREDKLLAKYLMLFFTRPEFDRYARFHSWGSARENFNWSDMCHVKIPIPPLEIQQSIVHIYEAYRKRKQINERLKAQLKDICPILIRGSLKEVS